MLAVAISIVAASRPSESYADAALEITITDVVRYIRPASTIRNILNPTGWRGACYYIGTVKNFTPYHINSVKFRSLLTISDMRANSQYNDRQFIGLDTINAPNLTQSDDGRISINNETYKITGLSKGDYDNCEDAVRAFVAKRDSRTYVSKCDMDGITEGECLSRVHVYLPDDFINQAINSDNGNAWVWFSTGKSIRVPENW
jgi:hypothetical protein